ncbi:MAG: DUF3604 domain-containing protein [Oscillospiraceae bacterium]|nr:DUF3604 domain-containing protein [Oscillospiraceae bacterium]
MSNLVYEGPKKMKANQLFKCKLTVEIGEEIETGGIICVASRHVSDIGYAQCRNPEDDNYIEFFASRGDVALTFELRPGDHPWNRGFSLSVSGGKLQKGDTVTIVMGKGRGFRAQSFSETNSGFRLGIKQNKNAPWIVSQKKEAEFFEVTGADAIRIRAYVKDVGSACPNKRVCLKMEDIYSNIGSVAEGAEFGVYLDDAAYLGKMAVDGRGVSTGNAFFVPSDDKWHTLSIVSSDGKFFARTNPFGPPLLKGLNVYFGDIHSQSGLCDGTNSPKYLYRYAKTAAGLDFASVSSHDMELDDDAWEEIKKETKLANEPGEFVTLLGYEWSGSEQNGGDNNIYYKSDDGALVRNMTLRTEWCIPDMPEESNDLADTIAKIKQNADEFMVIPHCGGRQCNFDFYDPSVMSVFEIHSTHRNYEHIWREAVSRGLKMGLAGGSDDHRGMIGDCATAARERFFSSHSGLICVYAADLTRGAIWDAIKKRHTYATNGPHIVISFAMGGYIMGDEAILKTGATMEFEFAALSHGFIDRLEIYRNSDIAENFCGANQVNQVTEYRGIYKDSVRKGLNLYYLKAIQTDGGTAWSSPIFVYGN